MNFKIEKPEDKQAVWSYIDSLPNGKRYDINIARHRERRTIDQNRLLFLWINCISNETGQDKDDLHIYFKHKFLPPNYIRVLGLQIYITPTTTTLDTKQFTDYLNSIQVFAAAELGITLPNPEDAIWAQFYEQYSNHI